MGSQQKMRLPLYIAGKVVKGFGRGSKELGCPTANLNQSAVDKTELETGIYYGWAKVDDYPVYPMVTSVGWNPYFKNKVKSIETHILHDFNRDFYESELKICLTGYIRNEMNFNNLEELKKAIESDINTARIEMTNPEQAQYKLNPFFSSDSRSGSEHHQPTTTTNGYH